MMLRALSAALAVALSLGVAAAKESRRHCSLDYRPTESSDGSSIDLTGLSSTVLQVHPLGDRRDPKESIGKNLEEEDKGTLLVTTDSDVADFVTRTLRKELLGAGIEVADERANRILRGDVLEFNVELNKKFRASVKIKVEVTDAGGKELYTGLATGSANRFSFKESCANYLEALSDALFDALQGLLNNESFLRSLRSAKK